VSSHPRVRDGTVLKLPLAPSRKTCEWSANEAASARVAPVRPVVLILIWKMHRGDRGDVQDGRGRLGYFVMRLGDACVVCPSCAQGRRGRCSRPRPRPLAAINRRLDTTV
jgi:hypothetical protein